jgi:hypothetical protein
MNVDSTPQPCPRCHRPVLLAGYSWGRQWVHLGTWRPQCGPPSWVGRYPDAGSDPRDLPQAS